MTMDTPLRGGGVPLDLMDASIGRTYTASSPFGPNHFGAVTVFVQPEAGAAVRVFANGLEIPATATWDSGPDASGVNRYTDRPAFRVSIHYVNVQPAAFTTEAVLITADASNGQLEGWIVYPFVISGFGLDTTAVPFKDLQFRSGYSDRFEGGDAGTTILTDNDGEVVFFYGTTPTRVITSGTVQEIPDPDVHTVGTKYVAPTYPLETPPNQFIVANTLRADVPLPGGISILKTSILRPPGGGDEAYIRDLAVGARYRLPATAETGWQGVVLPAERTATTLIDAKMGIDIGNVTASAQVCRPWLVENTIITPTVTYGADTDIGLDWEPTTQNLHVSGIVFYSFIDRPGSEIVAGVTNTTFSDVEVCTFDQQDIVAGWNTWTVSGGPFVLNVTNTYTFWVRFPANEDIPEVATEGGNPNVQEGTGLALNAIKRRSGGGNFGIAGVSSDALSIAVYPEVCTAGAIAARPVDAWLDNPLTDPTWGGQLYEREHGILTIDDADAPWSYSSFQQEFHDESALVVENEIFWESSPQPVPLWWGIKFTTLTNTEVSPELGQISGSLSSDQLPLWNDPFPAGDPDDPVLFVTQGGGKLLFTGSTSTDLSWDGTLNLVPGWDQNIVEGVGIEEAGVQTKYYRLAFTEELPTPTIPFPAGSWGTYTADFDTDTVSGDAFPVSWFMLGVSLIGVGPITSDTRPYVQIVG